jgi:lipopolysaccharide transport system ATP-binding protein
LPISSDGSGQGDNAIEVEGLGKRYRIGAPQERYRTLRDHLARTARGVAHGAAAMLRGVGRRRDERNVWALRDVAFTVKSGEVLGVIGRNGAGKTTLLKILSRITEPTAGEARIRGRVGSLLEVGTGFHPELTGRENVYLNGAILGMTRREIGGKFDQIVAFAEIDRYVDTAVKHYSSGMYVRLAFSVAAHLEPDVLLVDEVLAVGDAGFQRKCIASIRDSTGQGRTALVVTHSLGLLRSLCTRAILLDGGRLIEDGPTDRVIAAYHAISGSAAPLYRAEARDGRQSAFVARAQLRDARGNVVTELPCGEGCAVELTVQCLEGGGVARPWIGVRILAATGELICHTANREAGSELPPLSGRVIVRCDFPWLNLLPGTYALGFVVADTDNRVYDRGEGALHFTVTARDVFNSGFILSRAHGQVFYSSRWAVAQVEA